MELTSNMFKGRISRGLFFISMAGLGAIAGIIQVLKTDVKIQYPYLYKSYFEYLLLILVIFLLIIHLSIVAKRWHDMGKSGYLSLLSLIPYLNFIVIAYLTLKRGDDKVNKYGEKPKSFTI